MHFHVPPASGNPPSTVVQRDIDDYIMGGFSVTEGGNVMGFGLLPRPAPFNSLVTLYKPRLLTRIGGEWQAVQDLPELERSLANGSYPHATCMEPDGTMYMAIKTGSSISYVWKKPPGGQWGIPNPNAGLSGQPERLHNFDFGFFAGVTNAHAFMPRAGGGAIVITGANPYVVTLYPDGTQARGSTIGWPGGTGAGHEAFRMSDGRIVLFWLRVESSQWWYTVAWSDDDGQSWTYGPDPTTHQNGAIIATGWLGGNEFYAVYTQRLTTTGDVLQYNVFNMDTQTWRFPQSLPARSAINTVASAPRFGAVRVVGDMITWSDRTTGGSTTGTWARQITPSGLGPATQMTVPGQSSPREIQAISMVGPGKYLAVQAEWLNYFDGTSWTGAYANIVPAGYGFSSVSMIKSSGPTQSGTVGILSAFTSSPTRYATFSLDALDRPIA